MEAGRVRRVPTFTYSIMASLKDHLQVVHLTNTCVICPITRKASQDISDVVCAVRSSVPKHRRAADFQPTCKNRARRNLGYSADALLSCHILMTRRCLQQPYSTTLPGCACLQFPGKLAVSGFLKQYANTVLVTFGQRL